EVQVGMPVAFCTALFNILVANLKEILLHLVNHFPILNERETKFLRLVFEIKRLIDHTPQEKALFEVTIRKAKEMCVLL
ncbi:hypothetical protein L0F63_003526, partial [Massospora cicadina]